MCKSLGCMEDEQRFLFYCPAYNHVRSQNPIWDLLQHCATIADFMSLCEPNAYGGFLRECFVGSKLNFLSVGSQMPLRTLNVLIG